jgi:hypothetical protein
MGLQRHGAPLPRSFVAFFGTGFQRVRRAVGESITAIRATRRIHLQHRPRRGTCHSPSARSPRRAFGVFSLTGAAFLLAAVVWIWILKREAGARVTATMDGRRAAPFGAARGRCGRGCLGRIRRADVPWPDGL